MINVYSSILKTLGSNLICTFSMGDFKRTEVYYEERLNNITIGWDIWQHNNVQYIQLVSILIF